MVAGVCAGQGSGGGLAMCRESPPAEQSGEESVPAGGAEGQQRRRDPKL